MYNKFKNTVLIFIPQSEYIPYIKVFFGNFAIGLFLAYILNKY